MSNPVKYTTFLKSSPKELGNDNVKLIKDQIQLNVQTLLTTTIPQKIEEYKTSMQKLFSFTLEQVKNSIVIPNPKEIIVDTKNRKFEVENFKKIKRKAMKEAKKSYTAIEKEKTTNDSSTPAIEKEEEKNDDVDRIIRKGNKMVKRSHDESDSDDSDEDDVFEMKFEGHSMRRIFPSSLKLPSNVVLVQMMEISQKVFDEMIKILTNLRIWLELSIPPMVEGGDNGAEIIQAHIETTYRKNRVELASDLVTSIPGCVDRTQVLIYCDVDMFHKLRQSMTNGVQSFMVVYDSIVKNLNRLTNPRGKDTNNWLY